MGATIEKSAEWIDEERLLSRRIERWQSAEALALDTEFVRTDTFFAKLGLIQIADRHGAALVDPLAVDVTPVFKLLANDQITKVMHSGSEDIAILLTQGKIDPSPIFDTQLAAGLLGLGPSLSYPALSIELLGIELDKGQQRSNWLQRPLSAAQRTYASNDVVHLLEVHQLLRERLIAAERFDWLQEDCDRLIENVNQNQSIQQHYQRFKLGWKLDSVGRGILWRLLEWRETDAIRLDRPRQRVLRDETILHLALEKPNSIEALKRAPKVSQGLIRKVGPELIKLIEHAQATPTEEQPARLPRPLGPETKSLMNALKTIVRQAAEGLQLPPELLCSRRDFVALIRNRALPQRLQGWRGEIIGQDLTRCIQGD